MADLPDVRAEAERQIARRDRYDDLRGLAVDLQATIDMLLVMFADEIRARGRRGELWAALNREMSANITERDELLMERALPGELVGEAEVRILLERGVEPKQIAMRAGYAATEANGTTERRMADKKRKEHAERIERQIAKLKAHEARLAAAHPSLADFAKEQRERVAKLRSDLELTLGTLRTRTRESSSKKRRKR